MKKNILQTFEDFIKEPLSILKKTIVSITGIDTAVIGAKSISVQTTPDGIQIDVVNSPKTYKLLSSVIYKKQVQRLRHLIHESEKREVSNKFALTQRST